MISKQDGSVCSKIRSDKLRVRMSMAQFWSVSTDLERSVVRIKTIYERSVLYFI